MSWQSYVDEHLMVALPGGGALESAAIFGQDGNVWAQSASFPACTPDFIKSIVAGFDQPADIPGGLKFNGQKYMVVGGDAGEVIRGKLGQGGCTIKKTASAIVIGIYAEGVQPGDCNVIVENLGDYLMQQGI